MQVTAPHLRVYSPLVYNQTWFDLSHDLTRSKSALPAELDLHTELITLIFDDFHLVPWSRINLLYSQPTIPPSEYSFQTWPSNPSTAKARVVGSNALFHFDSVYSCHLSSWLAWFSGPITSRTLQAVMCLDLDPSLNLSDRCTIRFLSITIIYNLFNKERYLFSFCLTVTVNFFGLSNGSWLWCRSWSTSSGYPHCGLW